MTPPEKHKLRDYYDYKCISIIVKGERVSPSLAMCLLVQEGNSLWSCLDGMWSSC